MKNFSFRNKNTLYVAVLVLLAFLVGIWLGRPGSSAATANETAAVHQHTEESSSPEWWTCSMHPQIKLPEPGQCPICFMDLIPLETTSSDDGPRELTLSKAAAELADVAVARVERHVAEAEIRLSGIVEYDETRLGKIAAWVPGRLERLYVDFTGVEVQKGDHMVDMYSPELVATQEELRQAHQQVEAVRDKSGGLYKTVVSNLEAVREKLRLLGLSPSQVEDIEKGEDNEDIITILSPLSGIVLHKNAVEGMYVQTGTPIYTIADLSRVWVVLDAYESDISWLKYGQDVSFTVEAVPGKVFQSRVAFIDPVLDPKTRTVKVRLNVNNAAHLLKPGMFIRATVHSMLDAQGRSVNPELAGKWIGTMHPDIVKDQPGTCDICGMPLQSTESLGIVSMPASSELPLLVPATAVLLTGKRAVVYVKKPNTETPTFEGREVVLGARAGDAYIVEAGLEEGEEVVVKGNFKIDSAMQIAAKPSMMNPTGGGPAPGHHHGMANMQAGTETMKDMPVSGKQVDISQELLEGVLMVYLRLQENLARDNYDKAYKNLMEIHRLTMGVPGAEAIMNPTMKPVSDIEQLRKVFEELSLVLRGKAAEGGFGETLYEAFCPMAFNNKGAYWLQQDKQISNPYLGQKMPRCGEIKKTFDQ